MNSACAKRSFQVVSSALGALVERVREIKRGEREHQRRCIFRATIVRAYWLFRYTRAGPGACVTLSTVAETRSRKEKSVSGEQENNREYEMGMKAGGIGTVRYCAASSA